jgi:hypothetical protein
MRGFWENKELAGYDIYIYIYTVVEMRLVLQEEIVR